MRDRVVRATLAVVCAAITVSPLAAVPGQSVVRSVHLLPAGNRTSLVIELESTVAGANTVDVHETDEFVVDIGPVAAEPAAQILRAGAASPLIREVKILRITSASRQPMVRVQVKLQAAATGTVRVADRRVYLDFVPTADRPEPAVLAATTPAAPPAVSTASRVTPTVVPPPSGVTPAPLAATRQPSAPEGESPDTWLERAKTLSQIPDVKGLTALRARVATSTSNPADGVGREQTLAQIDGYLAEAQRRQLVKDAQLFRQAQIEAYISALRQAISDLDAIKASLGSPKGPSTGAEASARFNQLAMRLHALDAPSELSAQHARACAAADAAVAVVARASASAAPGPDSDVHGGIDRTRSALTDILAATAKR